MEPYGVILKCVRNESSIVLYEGYINNKYNIKVFKCAQFIRVGLN